MNITTRQLAGQLTRVQKNGWWQHLEDAVHAYFPAGEFDACDLFGVGSRETNWDPRYLKEPGDNGNGFGFMQIDKRSFPDWVAGGKWKNAREGILMGGAVLRGKLNQARGNQGKKLVVRDRTGTSFTITGKKLSRTEERAVALAAYNSGIWAHYHFSKGRSPDHGTTGRDYSHDVLERAATARNSRVAPSKICPACKGTGRVPT